MKKVFIFILAAAMLTGCGGGGKDEAPTVTHPKATMTGDGVMIEEDDEEEEAAEESVTEAPEPSETSDD